MSQGYYHALKFLRQGREDSVILPAVSDRRRQNLPSECHTDGPWAHHLPALGQQAKGPGDVYGNNRNLMLHGQDGDADFESLHAAVEGPRPLREKQQAISARKRIGAPAKPEDSVGLSRVRWSRHQRGGLGDGQRCNRR
jgi:hypothetical protein